jgi:hypothetical protein
MYHQLIAEERQVERDSIGFWDVVQTLAAYVAVPVALLYPVGFFALFFQFMNYYFLDFYTAWYAAYLVNRMVAIEEGVTILALALMASVVLAAFVNRVLSAHDEGGVPVGDELPTAWAKLKAASKLSGFERRGWLYAKLIVISLGIFVFYLAYSRIVAGGRPTLLSLRGRLSTECSEVQITRHQLELWPDSIFPASIFLVGCLWGGWPIYRFHQAYLRRLDAEPAERGLANTILEGVTKGWILSGLAVAYTFSVAASIVLAWHTPSFVPYMTYGPTVEHRGEPNPTENRFLSHTEGQWYFLHRIPKRDDEKDPRNWTPPDYTVVSLREGGAKYVRVRPIPPRVSRVAPLLGVFGEKPLEKHPCMT